MSYFPQLYSFTVKFGQNIRLLPHFRSIVSALQGIEEKMSDDEQENAMIILIWVKKVLIQPSIGAVIRVFAWQLDRVRGFEIDDVLTVPLLFNDTSSTYACPGGVRVKRTGVLIVLFRGLKKAVLVLFRNSRNFRPSFFLDGVKSHQWQTSNSSKISRFFENIPTSNNMLDRLSW